VRLVRMQVAATVTSDEKEDGMSNTYTQVALRAERCSCE
jgi:hypothetical protein